MPHLRLQDEGQLPTLWLPREIIPAEIIHNVFTLKCCSSHIFFYTQVRLSLGFYTPMCTRWVSLRVMLPCASKKWYQGPVETGVDIAFPISPMGTNHVCQYRRQKTMSHSEIQVIIFHRFHPTHFLLCEVALLQCNWDVCFLNGKYIHMNYPQMSTVSQ